MKKLQSLRKDPKVVQKAKELQQNATTGGNRPYGASNPIPQQNNARIPVTAFHNNLASHYQRYTNAPVGSVRQDALPQQAAPAPASNVISLVDDDDDDDFFDALDQVEEQYLAEKAKSSPPPAQTANNVDDDEIVLFSSSQYAESRKRKRDASPADSRKKQKPSVGSKPASQPEWYREPQKKSFSESKTAPPPKLPPQQTRKPQLPPQRKTAHPSTPPMPAPKALPPQRAQSNIPPPQRPPLIDNNTAISTTPARIPPPLPSPIPAVQSPLDLTSPNSPSPQARLQRKSPTLSPPPLPKLDIPTHLPSLVNFMTLGVNPWTSYNFLDPRFIALGDPFLEDESSEEKRRDKKLIPRKILSTLQDTHKQSSSQTPKKKRCQDSNKLPPSAPAAPPMQNEIKHRSIPNGIASKHKTDTPRKNCTQRTPNDVSRGKDITPKKSSRKTPRKKTPRKRDKNTPRKKRTLGVVPGGRTAHVQKKRTPVSSASDLERSHVEESGEDSNFDDEVEYFSSLSDEPSQADTINSDDDLDDESDGETGSLREFVSQSTTRDDHGEFVPEEEHDEDEELSEHVVEEEEQDESMEDNASETLN